MYNIIEIKRKELFYGDKKTIERRNQKALYGKIH